MNKIMDVAEKQIVRREILNILAETDEQGATPKLLKVALMNLGHCVDELDVTKELSYLKNKQLIRMEQVANQALGIRRDIAYITAEGIDFLEGTIQVAGIEAGE